MGASAGVGAFLGPASQGISGPDLCQMGVVKEVYGVRVCGLREMPGTDRMSDMSEQWSSPGEASHLLLWILCRHEIWSHEVRSQVGTGESELISSCYIPCCTSSTYKE